MTVKTIFNISIMDFKNVFNNSKSTIIYENSMCKIKYIILTSNLENN